MDNLTKEQKDWLDSVDEIINNLQEQMNEISGENVEEKLKVIKTARIEKENLDKKGRLEVGKTYYAFDDGKITWSRLLRWEILKEVDLNQHKLDIETLEMLKYETEHYDWLFDRDQRYIYYAKAVDKEGNYDKDIGYCWFLKSGNSYFGTGDWASRLDIDGSLYRQAMDYYG